MSSTSSPLRQLKKRLLAVMLTVAVAVAVTLVAIRWLQPTPPPLLTIIALQSASDRWREANVRDYELDIEIFGRQPGRVHLEVRGGEPVAMTRDGRTPGQRRTWEAWTVESQFGMIRDEWAKRSQPEGFGAPPGSLIVQRARFDERLGYPLDYQRTILGTPLDIEWRVVKFVIVDQHSSQPLAPSP